MSDCSPCGGGDTRAESNSAGAAAPVPQVIPADREDATDARVVTYLSTVEPLSLRWVGSLGALTGSAEMGERRLDLMRPFGVDDPGEHAHAISSAHAHQGAPIWRLSRWVPSRQHLRRRAAGVTLGGDPIGAADRRPCRTRRNVNPRERMVRSGCFGDVMV